MPEQKPEEQKRKVTTAEFAAAVFILAVSIPALAALLTAWVAGTYKLCHWIWSLIL